MNWIPGKITGLNEELPQLNYYLVPVFLITGGAFFIADIFFGVYEMGVDTLFLCFLEVTKCHLLFFFNRECRINSGF